MYSPVRSPSYSHHELTTPHCYYPHPPPHLPYHLQSHHPWIYKYPVEGSLRPSYSIQSGLSEVFHTREKITIKLDVQDYSPDELVVKTVDEHLLVEGKHEEKADEHGYITRSFKRRYVLPPEVDKDDVQVECEIGLDGVLRISVPKKLSVTTGNEKVHAIKKVDNSSVVTKPTQ